MTGACLAVHRLRLQDLENEVTEAPPSAATPGALYPVAVRRVIHGHAREEQDGFAHFRACHNFEARFRYPDEGHEKGGGVGRVWYLRRNVP